MTHLLPRRRTRRVAVPLLVAALLAGCSTDGTDAPPTAAPTAAPTTGSEPTASATAAPPAAAPQAPAGDEGPEDSFRTWLAASRAPDVATACAYMTPELAQRMVDEITARGFPGITDCATLIEMTAGLYAAVGQSSETQVELLEQSADSARLHVVYTEGSSCGSIVLQPGDGHWVLTERSAEEC